MIDMANRVAGFGTTVFTEINDLAREYGAVNLGQGAPDFETSPHVIEAASRAVTSDHHQYPPGWGYSEMREAVAHHAERFYGLHIDPMSQVVITNGATEGIFAAMIGLINPGDEVILIEPFYDSYLPSILWAGGVPRYIPLHAPDWHFDRDEMESLFSSKTRAIMLNTPHNPTGKVFTREELEFIAELCQRHDALVITDEVYEHILFDGAEHVPMASIPGMAERTITLSSVGKTFSITGWKIGWAIAPPELATGIWRARQFITFTVASVLQWAMVDILHSPDSYFHDLCRMYQAKRDLLYDGLAQSPLKPLKPQGSYFIMADSSALGLPDDRAAAEYLIKQVGVAPIPPSAFYSDAHRELAKHLLRFSFCKVDETLHAAVERLQKIGT